MNHQFNDIVKFFRDCCKQLFKYVCSYSSTYAWNWHHLDISVPSVSSIHSLYLSPPMLSFSDGLAIFMRKYAMTPWRLIKFSIAEDIFLYCPNPLLLSTSSDTIQPHMSKVSLPLPDVRTSTSLTILCWLTVQFTILTPHHSCALYITILSQSISRRL